MRILLASPRGFCAGVDRAIEIVELALARFGAPVYVRHEIVHNRYVVDELRPKGAVFVDEPGDAPRGARLVYSAHGVSPAVRRAAAEQGLDTIDATCPLVTKVHNEVKRLVALGYQVVMVGHLGHVEVEGTMGQAPGKMYLVETVEDVRTLEVKNPERLGCVTQTTLSVDDTAVVMESLVKRFPAISLPKRDDICYATQNRQDAVKQLAPDCDVFIVVGSPSSSNSNRLRELASKLGTTAYLVDNAADLERAWFDGARKVGLTAGASAPETLVRELIDYLRGMDDVEVEQLDGVEERVHFKMPAELAGR